MSEDLIDARVTTQTRWSQHRVPSGRPWTYELRLGLRQVAVLVRKDVTLEVRTREAITPMVIFGLMVVIMFSFAFDLTPESMSTSLTSGLLWTALLFSGVLGMGRTFASEREQGGADNYRLAPVAGSTLFLAKFLSSGLLLVALDLVLLPAIALLFNVAILNTRFLAGVFLGTTGIAVTGTLFGAMAAGSRAREVLLPVVWLPVLVPLLIAAVQSSAEALQGPSLLPSAPWLRLIAVFDVLYFVIALSVYGEVIRE